MLGWNFLGVFHSPHMVCWTPPIERGGTEQAPGGRRKDELCVVYIRCQMQSMGLNAGGYSTLSSPGEGRKILRSE